MEQIDLKQPIEADTVSSNPQNGQTDWFEYEGTMLVRLKAEHKKHKGTLYIPGKVKDMAWKFSMQ